MKITKKFNFEGSHVVRNCSSWRCSHSIHGHSYTVEVEFEGSKLDNAGMLWDFGLTKTAIKGFIDSMDHCHMVCQSESDEVIEFFRKHNDRYILVPFNPTAEMIGVFILKTVQDILDSTETVNGEDINLKVSSVTVHETKSGRAQAFPEDVEINWNNDWEVIYSEGVVKDWSEELKTVMSGGKIKNPVIKQQIFLQGFNDDCFEI